jgi:hypothetical protein
VKTLEFLERERLAVALGDQFPRRVEELPGESRG